MRLPVRAIRLIALLMAATAVVVAAISVPATPASAVTTKLSGSQFIPGNIIDDAHFFNGSAMTQTQIQNFLTGQQGTCTNSSCLSQLKIATTTKAADGYCPKAYQGSSSESAAAVIYKVQVACNVSAAVLLVTLEKEQGLVSSRAPSTYALQHAMGYLCPDTAPCNAGAAGFFSQVYGAARQFQLYRLYPNSFNFRAGIIAKIQYSPTASCGTESVYIANAATAALYNYTPYVPNAAALANLGGVGNSCSSYGNRNFWVNYNTWFGSGTAPFGVVDKAAVASNVATVTGWAIDPSLPLASNSVKVQMTNASGTTTTTTVTANQNRPDVGKVYPYAAQPDGTTLHGYTFTSSQSVRGQYSFCVSATTAPASYSTAPPTSLGCTYQWYNPGGPTPTTTRLAGTDRYATAVAVSQASYPSGTVPVVYLASGESYYDALSAAPAAAVQGGPLLLTTQTSVPSSTLAELKRLKPAKIVVVGGTSAVSDAAASAAAAATGAALTRLAGANRFLTSQAVAKAIFPKATRAFAVSGLDYPDALSASSAAGVLGAPILLSNGTATAADGTLDTYLRASTTIKTVDVVGGTAVMVPTVVSGIQQAGKTVTRVAGADRFLTSNAVASTFFPTAAQAYLATGTQFADALTGSVAAARAKGPLMIVRPTCVPAYDGQTMVKAGTSQVKLLGGTSALGPLVDKLGVCT